MAVNESATKAHPTRYEDKTKVKPLSNWPLLFESWVLVIEPPLVSMNGVTRLKEFRTPRVPRMLSMARAKASSERSISPKSYHIEGFREMQVPQSCAENLLEFLV